MIAESNTKLLHTAQAVLAMRDETNSNGGRLIALPCDSGSCSGKVCGPATKLQALLDELEKTVNAREPGDDLEQTIAASVTAHEEWLRARVKSIMEPTRGVDGSWGDHEHAAFNLAQVRGKAEARVFEIARARGQAE